MFNLYLFLSAVVVTVGLALFIFNFIVNFWNKDDTKQKINLDYDYQEDIANYNNDYNNYDYDKDCNIPKYQYDDINEVELSQEWVDSHSEEDKN